MEWFLNTGSKLRYEGGQLLMTAWKKNAFLFLFLFSSFPEAGWIGFRLSYYYVWSSSGIRQAGHEMTHQAQLKRNIPHLHVSLSHFVPFPSSCKPLTSPSHLIALHRIGIQQQSALAASTADAFFRMAIWSD